MGINNSMVFPMILTIKKIDQNLGYTKDKNIHKACFWRLKKHSPIIMTLLLSKSEIFLSNFPYYKVCNFRLAKFGE